MASQPAPEMVIWVVASPAVGASPIEALTGVGVGDGAGVGVEVGVAAGVSAARAIGASPTSNRDAAAAPSITVAGLSCT